MNLSAPAASPPPGQTSNFDSPPNLRVLGLAGYLLAFILPSVSLAMRIYTKLVIIRRFNLSDYCMCMAWALLVGCISVVWLANEISPAVDQWNLRLGDLIEVLYYNGISFILYSSCILLLKLSILLQFLEIFTVEHDWFFWSCQALIWINGVYYTTTTFLAIFACQPVSRLWQSRAINGSCTVDTTILVVAATCVNAISDATILTLPQIHIWKMHAPLRTKLRIAAAFSLGFLATGFCFLRMVFAIHLFSHPRNMSYYGWWSGFLGVFEITLGMLAGCLPSCMKFIRTLAQRVAAWRKNRKRQDSLSPLVPDLSQEKGNRTCPRGQLRDTDAEIGHAHAVRVERDQYPLSSFLSISVLSFEDSQLR
ncbi:hypothetical protein BJY04DRAFT_223314 [Aspergillus karnatakaensis]|uniref:uncharacterized protein n=1 Tax=Aspergillus karnatakaensis TaxID=1810916 RepID=UPI003CCCC487